MKNKLFLYVCGCLMTSCLNAFAWVDENGNNCYADSQCVYAICPRITCRDNRGVVTYSKNFDLDTSGYKGDKSDISYEWVKVLYDNKTDTWSFYNPNAGKYQELSNDLGIYKIRDGYMGYDENGKMISTESIHYNASGTMIVEQKSTYEYDQNGNSSKTSDINMYYRDDGSIRNGTRWAYEYDENGNK